MTPTVCDPEDFAQDRFVAVRAPGVDRVDFGISPSTETACRPIGARVNARVMCSSQVSSNSLTRSGLIPAVAIATLWTDAGPVGATRSSV